MSIAALPVRGPIAAGRRVARALVTEQLIWLIVIVAAIAMGELSGVFWTWNNILDNVLRQSAVTAILALGMTFVIATRGFDLSVGSNIALSTCAMALLIREHGAPVSAGIAVCLAVATLIGVANGLLVAVVGIPPFIATLGMLSLARGLALVQAGTTPIDVLPHAILAVGRGKVGPIPAPAIALAAVWIACELLLRYARFGRYALAIGGNEEASRLSGVRVTGYGRMLAILQLENVACAI